MRRVVISGMIGNGLEWYDFALYGHFAAIISRHFFPSDDPLISLIATYGAFAAGFAMRPLGAILFGYIGDRYGRKISLAIAILMMAIPTACIGLLPTYAHIGVMAPILLTLIRLLQGLSLGGEFSGSITFIVEHSSDHRRGLAGSASMASLVAGMLLGSLVATVTSELMTEAQLIEWGWRIPFALGLLIGFVGFYIRHHTDESPKYIEAKEADTLSKRPLRDAFGKHLAPMAQGVGIYLTVTLPFYILAVFMLSYLSTVLGHSIGDSLILNTITMLFMLPVIIWSARLSDRVGRKPVLFVSALALLLLAYPIFMLINSGSFVLILLGLMIFALINGTFLGPVPAVLVELFPTSVRYTAMAISYNIAGALFGGTAPIVSTWLIRETGDPKVVAFYLMASAAVTLFTLFWFKDRYRDPLI
ncbi:MAG: MFS transporter [Rickettsiales bacterium]|nr:MFS transporter [Rickettsiales bacterium]